MPPVVEDSQVGITGCVHKKSEKIIHCYEKEKLTFDNLGLIEEENGEKVIHTSLPYLQATLFASFLEDTITQLRILVECNNELRIIKAKTEWKSLLRKKFGVEELPTVDQLADVDPSNLACDEYKIVKLDHDRKFCTDAITATYKDLSLEQSFKALLGYVNSEIEKAAYRTALAEEEACNRIQRREIVKQLRQQRNHNKSVLYDANVKIDLWKTKAEDALLDAECKNRYVTNWQRARTEQHTQDIHNKEVIYAENIEYFKERSDYEQRVHTEVELLMSIKLNEILANVEIWMDKYDKDMEDIELRIQIKRHDHKNMLEKRMDLEKTFEKHGEEMKAWIVFKEEREKLRLYRETMTNCAIIVQAWWRGLLVRRQLGPYKNKKKKTATKK